MIRRTPRCKARKRCVIVSQEDEGTVERLLLPSFYGRVHICRADYKRVKAYAFSEEI
jgi:hypothetical protein